MIKVFERVAVRKMVRYKEDNRLYSCNQHGFRRGRSCLSQLLEQHAEILESLSSGVCAADKCMQRANVQQRFFWSDFFLHCVHSSVVLVEQDLISFLWQFWYIIDTQV